MVSVGLVYVLFASALMGLFAERGQGSGELLEVGTTMLALSAIWQLFDALGRWVRIAFGIAAVGYALAWVAFRRDSERGKSAGIAALSLTTMLTMQAGFIGSDVFRATRSSADLVTLLENASDPPYDRSAPFFQVRMYDQTLPYYLQRTTTLVEYRDELCPGLRGRSRQAVGGFEIAVAVGGRLQLDGGGTHESLLG